MKKPVMVLYNNPCQDGYANDGDGLSNLGILEEATAVRDALESLGYESFFCSIDTLSDLPGVLAAHPQVEIIFNLVEELPNSILHACYVPAICDAFGKSCTGNPTEALLLCQDKIKTKAVLVAGGVDCPAGVGILQKITGCEQLEPGRYIIKPALTDASEGIEGKCVFDWPGFDYLTVARRMSLRFGQPVVVERYIHGREFNISIIHQADGPRVLEIAEICFENFADDAVKVLDYSSKWHKDSFVYNNTVRRVPADVSSSLKASIRRVCLDSWHLCGCRDYARVDLRVDAEEKVYVLEINPNPDISPDAGFAAAVAASGIAYKDFVDLMVTNAMYRSQTTSA